MSGCLLWRPPWAQLGTMQLQMARSTAVSKAYQCWLSMTQLTNTHQWVVTRPPVAVERFPILPGLWTWKGSTMDITAKEDSLEAVVFPHFVWTRRGGFDEKGLCWRSTVKTLPHSGFPTPDLVKLCTNVWIVVLVNRHELGSGSWLMDSWILPPVSSTKWVSKGVITGGPQCAGLWFCRGF